MEGLGEVFEVKLIVFRFIGRKELKDRFWVFGLSIWMFGDYVLRWGKLRVLVWVF